MKTDDIIKVNEWLIDTIRKLSKEYDTTEDESVKTCIHFFFLSMKHFARDELWRMEDPDDYNLHMEAMMSLLYSDDEDDDGE